VSPAVVLFESFRTCLHDKGSNK